MNINVSLGILSFLIWSTFSTWLYVNYIKVYNPVVPKELVKSAEQLNKFDSVADNATPKLVLEIPTPIKLSKVFTFHKNTTNLIRPAAIGRFTDSLQTVLKDRSVTVSITGHTCDLGKEAYNYQLSTKRANYVAKVLKASSITWPPTTIISQGESNPIVPNTSESNRIKNRRVTILIITKP